MPKTMPRTEFLSVKEAAAILGVRPVTIFRMLKDKRLAGRKVGRDWRIPKAAFEKQYPTAEPSPLQAAQERVVMLAVDSVATQIKELRMGLEKLATRVERLERR